ncbi:MAG: aminodeoxychorismate synthase component I [Candidatus Krumholzibacteriia bacterium]
MTLTRTLPPGVPDPGDRWADSATGPSSACFLLESAPSCGSPGDRPFPGRWTFAGSDPAAILTARRTAGDFRLNLRTLRDPLGRNPSGSPVRSWLGDPLEALRDLQSAYGVDPPALPGDRPPFTGGLVGCFGYGLAHAVEDLRPGPPDDLDLPDLIVMVADRILAVDRQTGRATLWATGRGTGPAEARRTAQDALDAMEVGCAGKGPLRPPVRLEGADGELGGDVHAQMSPHQYADAVARCRQAILAGRIFEVCLTQRLDMALKGTGWDLYRVLRSNNPAPFAAYFRCGDLEVVSASPERFLKLDENGIAETRPIKGTAPRGRTALEDRRLRRRLAASPKDRAENVMIVDLARNDLGRVCTTGSVRVPELCVVESYPTVHQLVSTVRGRLRPDRDALDLVRACFPGGSMTGAPKIEAMKVISELEPVARGLYAGALGFLDRSGGLDLAMVIRTAVCTGGRAYFGVGGAVTADSDPAAEYRETLDKASALIRAVRLVGGREPQED